MNLPKQPFVDKPKDDSAKGILIWIRNKLIAGIFIAIPVFVTLWILKFIYVFISERSKPFLYWLIHHQLSFQAVTEESWWLEVSGFFFTIIFLFLLGLLTSNVIGRRLIEFFDEILLKVPVVRTIYNVMKQVVDAFSNTGNMNFKRVVFLQMSEYSGSFVGFVTGSYIDPMTGKSLTSVFIPTTPNVTTGFLVLAEEHQMKATDLSLEEGMKMVVSIGLVQPKRFPSGTIPTVPVQKE